MFSLTGASYNMVLAWIIVAFIGLGVYFTYTRQHDLQEAQCQIAVTKVNEAPLTAKCRIAIKP